MAGNIPVKDKNGRLLYRVSLKLRSKLDDWEKSMHPEEMDWYVLAESPRKARVIAKSYWNEEMVYEMEGPIYLVYAWGGGKV